VPAFDAFSAQFFNNMTLVLDRFFGHRLRMVTGKDCNPLNKVELICDSMMNNDGILRGNKVIKLVPEQTITKPTSTPRFGSAGKTSLICHPPSSPRSSKSSSRTRSGDRGPCGHQALP